MIIYPMGYFESIFLKIETNSLIRALNLPSDFRHFCPDLSIFKKYVFL